MNTDNQTNDYELILNEVLVAARTTSRFIKSHVTKVSSQDIEEKELNSLVSYVDKEAENQLVEHLSHILPEAGFITEEETENQTASEYVWIIDPLDGTTNFLNQVPHFSISIALQRNKETVLGMVREVNSGEEWTAIKGKGAYLNGSAIEVDQKPFNSILVSTGFPYSNGHDYEAMFRVLKHWLTHTRGMRRLGSAALDLCYVACGRYGAFYETTLNAWDVAAGALIVAEAGGIVSDFSKADNYLYGGEIIASSPIVYDEIIGVIQEHLL